MKETRTNLEGSKVKRPAERERHSRGGEEEEKEKEREKEMDAASSALLLTFRSFVTQ